MRLTEAEWRDREDFKRHWHDFSQCDYRDPDFADRMEAAGFIMWRTATVEDVDEEMFADELGIVEGEPIYVLTELGLALQKEEIGQ